MDWKKTLWILLSVFAALALRHELPINGTFMPGPEFLTFAIGVIGATCVSAYLANRLPFDKKSALNASTSVLLAVLISSLAICGSISFLASKVQSFGHAFYILDVLAIVCSIVPTVMLAASISSDTATPLVKSLQTVRTLTLVCAVPCCLLLMMSYTSFLIQGVTGVG